MRETGSRTAAATALMVAVAAGCGGEDIAGHADATDGADTAADTGGDTAWDPAGDATGPDLAPDWSYPDWVVPDAWDAPFDYMDVPSDYVPDPASCGNGAVDEGEECDDGNSIDHDECTNRCLFPRCGDGAVWWGWEDCDPPGSVRPCTSECGTMGGEYCEGFCRWTGECVPPVETCGNGVDDDCDGVVDGIVRYQRNVPVSVPPHGSEVAYLAWTGTDFAVLWDAYGHVPMLTRLNGWGMRIAPDVEVDIDIGVSGEGFEGLAWNGSSFGTYVSCASPRRIDYQAFAADGSLVGERRTIHTEESGSYEYVLTLSGQAGLAMVQESNWGDSFGYVVDLGGDSPVAGGLLYNAESWQMQLWGVGPAGGAAGGFEFVYQWDGVHLDTIDAAGAVTSSFDLDIPLDPVDPSSISGSVAASSAGDRFGVIDLWRHEMAFNAVDATGATIHREPVTGTASGSSFGDGTRRPPAVTYDGGAFSVFWIDTMVGAPQVFFARLSDDGETIVRPAALTDTAAPAASVGDPSPAWTGSSYGVAWFHYDGVHENVMFTHFAPCGPP